MVQLFHSKVGIPEALQHCLPYPRLHYSRHALDEARADHLSTLPSTLPEQFDVVEIECLNGIASKWTLRIPQQYHDLFLVVLRDGFVKTVWTFDRGVSKPLQLERYNHPQDYITMRRAA